LDTRENEVDAKFSNGEQRTTTVSEIDGKIESIESDDEERSTMLVSTTQQSRNELSESTTTEQSKTGALSTEKTSEIEQTTLAGVNVQKAEAVEEIREPRNNNEFERFATEAVDDESTKATKIVQIDSTTSKTATDAAVQQKSSVEATTEKSVTEKSEPESTKALQQIRKILRAHILRSLLILLNEAKQRQQSQTYELHAMESQVVEDKIHAVSGSNANDEVSTSDNGKIIAFDSDSQRYVYMDKEDYELMTGLRRNNVIMQFN
jgi:hypothetical protein